MREILPGVFHWTVMHPKIRHEVSSYYLAGAKVALDPLLPPGGATAFKSGLEEILLTNRHHYRDSGTLVQETGCRVWCVEQGLHEFTHGEKVGPFRFGDTLPGGFQAVEIGVLCPDETALLLPGKPGLIAVADGVVRFGDGPLTFLPDELLGDDPEAIKAGLKASYGRLLDRDFDHLLPAHGEPLIGGAKQALREFVEA